MKKSIKLTIVFALVVMLCALFAIFASAEAVNVEYHTTSGSKKATVTTDENGSITLKDTGYETTAGMTFYGWFTDDGTFYDPNETVIFKTNTKLYEAVAYDVSSLSEIGNKGGKIVRLTCDLVITSNKSFDWWTTHYIDLNGYTITADLSNRNESVFSVTRGSIRFFNSSDKEAKIIAKTKTNYGLVNLNPHSYGDGKNNRLVVGQNISIQNTGALIYVASSMVNDDDYITNPRLDLYGSVEVSTLVRQSGTNLQYDRAEINLCDGAKIKITGNTWWENMNTSTGLVQAVLTVGNVKFEVPDPSTFNWNANVLTTKFNVTGGSYNMELPEGILKNGYNCVYNETTNLYDVVLTVCTAEGSNGVHNFIPKESYAGMTSTCTGAGVYYLRCACGDYYIDLVDAVGHSYDILVSEAAATCTTKANKVFKCIRCDATNKVESGNNLGHSYTIVTIESAATATTSGVKRVTCDRCADSYTYNYSFDPRDQVVTITVKTDDGTKDIAVKVSDLYDITVTESNSGYTAKINKIKTITDPDNAEVTYTIANIVKIVIPAGITDIAGAVIKNGTVLTDIILLDGANATFASGSIENCVNLERITLGDCTVTFNSNVINGTTPNNLTIDAANGNFYMKGSAFLNETGLKKLIMGSYKTYKFDAESLKGVGLEEFIVPDYANLTAAYATFFQALSLKYIYIGRGITTIDNIFDQCFNMQTIVLMDVTSITGQYFACLANKGEDVLRIYHHSDSLTTTNNFLYQSYGVIFYTNATNFNTTPASMSGAVTKTVNGQQVTYPSYTIVKGIPHEYKEGNVDATCTAMGSTGYTTDCPCGVVENATYTKYKGVAPNTATTNANVEVGEIVIGATTDALGHEFDTEKGATVVGTTAADCLKNATTTYKCARCTETLVVETPDSALGHNVEGAEWIVSVEPKCAVEGFRYKTCVTCKALAVSEVVPATGHNIEGVEWSQTVAPTCTLAGTEVKKCTVCNTVAATQSINKLGHENGEFVTTLDPDCDDNGIKEQKCTRCQVLIATQAIEKLGHEFDTENGATIFADVPAGCLTDAVTTYKCARCAETNTVVYENTALGHEFDVADGAVLSKMEYANGFDKVGALLTKCARCTETSSAEVAPIFSAKGYATNPDRNAINGGYVVNTELLALYESYNGAITYGVVIANANAFTGNFFVDGKVNTEKAIQVPITMKVYSNFDCTISGFGANSSTLELVICAYIIDENGNATFIQAENDYAEATEIGGQTFTKVTLDLVLANVA